MLGPDELEYAAQVLQDETQTDESRALAEDLITDHWSELAQSADPEVRAEALQVLDSGGYELVDAQPGDPEYEAVYDQPPYDEQAYQQQMTEATMAAEQRGHEVAAQEQFDRQMQQHVEASLGALEQKLGRPLTERESAHTLAEGQNQLSYAPNEFPDLGAGFDAHNYNWTERTNKPADRVQAMVEHAQAIEAGNAPEWTQERIDNLHERDQAGSDHQAHEARTELMAAKLNGDVVSSDEQ